MDGDPRPLSALLSDPRRFWTGDQGMRRSAGNCRLPEGRDRPVAMTSVINLVILLALVGVAYSMHLIGVRFAAGFIVGMWTFAVWFRLRHGVWPP